MTNYEIVLKARLDEADKRIEELESAIQEGIDRAESYGCSDWSIAPLVQILSEGGTDE